MKIATRFILVFILGMAFYIAAILLQQKLPANDDAYNLERSYFTADKFDRESIPVLQQINALYWARSFRPNLLNPVGIVLMAATDGDFKISQLILTISEFVFFALALFYLFSKSSGSMTGAWQAGIILFTPWVFHGMTIFSSEGMGLVFFAWSIAFIFQVDFRNFESKSNRQYLVLSSIMAGLMIASKPVEGFLIFLPLLSFLALTSVDLKKVGWTALALLGSLLFPILYCYFIFKNQTTPENASTLLWGLSLLGLTGLCVLFCFFFRFLIPSFLLIMPCAFLSYFWFGPFSFGTLKWILDASIGTVARDTGGRGDLTAFTFLLYAFNSIFGYIMSGFLIWYSLFRKAWKKHDFIFLFCFLVPLLAGALSYNSDLRYYMFTGLGIILIIFAGAQRSPRQWLKKMGIVENIVFLALMISLLYHTASIFQFWQPLALMNKPGYGLWPNSVSFEKDITYERLKNLKENFNFNEPQNFCLIQMTSSAVDFHIDPWISTILLKKAGYKTRIIRPVPHNLSTMEDRFNQRVKDICCYVAVFPLVYEHSVPAHSLTDVGEWFLALHEQNNMAAVGFQLDRKLNLAPHTPTFDMLIFKNSRRTACLN